MQVQVNGAAQQLEEGTTLAALLVILELDPDGVAVAVNLSVVPRSRRAQHTLAAGDRVEIIRAVGGG